MENATKALLIAAGVMIGVMILTLGAALFASLDSYVQAEHERMEFIEQNAFNTQFIKYSNSNTLTIQDIVTAANLAHQNNIDYNADEGNRGNPASLYVAVYLEGTSIENANDDDIAELLTTATRDSKTYRCESDGLVFSQITGRVYEIYFFEN